MHTTASRLAAIALVAIVGIFSATTVSAFKQGGIVNVGGVGVAIPLPPPPHHQNITGEGLLAGSARTMPNWAQVIFTAEALDDIRRANAFVDSDHFKDSDFHFDADTFADSAANLRTWLRWAAYYAVQGDVAQARSLFGQALHLLQDFYAHSNFIELRSTLPSLRRPKFGLDSPFEGIGLPDNRMPGTSGGSACEKDGLSAAARLTTGYYDGAQSGPDVAPTFRKVENGIVITAELLTLLDAQHAFLYRIGEVVAIESLYPLFQFKFDTKLPRELAFDALYVHGLGWYTNEWSVVRNQYGSPEIWPSGRCVHGGDSGPGLNHDQEGRGPSFVLARMEAVEATREYLDLLLERMIQEADKSNEFDRYRNICRFFGTDGSRCDLATARVYSIQTNATAVREGEWIAVTVSGDNIPTTASVFMDEGSPCGLKTDASAKGFTMLCKPGGNHGAKSIYFRSKPTETAWSITASVTLVAAGRVFFLPAELTTDGISSWSISGLASWVTQVTWKFGSDVSDAVATVKDGALQTADTLLRLPGVRTVVAVLSSAFTDEQITLTKTVNVSQGATVASFESVGTVYAGQRSTFLLKGTKLPVGLVVRIQDCGLAIEDVDAGTETQRQFVCGFPLSTTEGAKDVGVGPVGSKGTMFEKALASGLTINVVKATVSQVVAAPAPMPGATSVVTVTGSNLPGTAGVLIDEAACDRATISAKTGGTGFTQTCRFGPGAGSKLVMVMSSGDASGFVIDDTRTLSVGSAAAQASLFDDFPGGAIDAAVWNIDGWDGTGNDYTGGLGRGIGPVSIGNGLVEFGRLGRISTKNKVTFSGDSSIVIEGRTASTGALHDTSVMLVDTTSGDQILMGDTNYAGWGFYAIGIGSYKLKEASTIGDPTNPLTLGNSTTAFMEYRLTITGDKIKIERGPTLANITQTGTGTLGRSIVGRTFHISIGAAWAYYPATWDWIRVVANPGPPTAGLVGHWSFDNCDARDSGPNALNGAYTGTLACVDGRKGKALRLNGASWITVPTSTAMPSSAVTMSYWLHREGLAPTVPLENYISKELSFQAYLRPAGTTEFGVWLGSSGQWTGWGSAATVLPTVNDWVHYTFTYDNATRQANTYLNGKLVHTVSETNPAAMVRVSNQPMFVGRNGSANVYHVRGLVDDVRLYNRALTPEEVSILAR